MAKEYKTCSVDGCNENASCKGFCHKHYARYKRFGTTELTRKKLPEICIVEGCDKKSKYSGYCYAHYHRHHRYGDPLKGGVMQGEPQKWLIKHKDYLEDDCLIWPFARNSRGYGISTLDGVTGYASRHMCKIAHGEPKDDKYQAAHTCGNGHNGCVNPKHLRWSTPKENTHDKFKHGTMLMGERHPQAKLQKEDILYIRSSNLSGKKLAELFGVTNANISSIRNRNTWTNI